MIAVRELLQNARSTFKNIFSDRPVFKTQLAIEQYRSLKDSLLLASGAKLLARRPNQASEDIPFPTLLSMADKHAKSLARAGQILVSSGLEPYMALKIDPLFGLYSFQARDGFRVEEVDIVRGRESARKTLGRSFRVYQII